MFLSKRNALSGSESGLALAELAYVLPFMTFLVCATIDIGRALNQYLDMTQVVQEGVRMASGLPDLTVGEFSSLDGPPKSHQVVQSRVVTLANLSHLPGGLTEITTSRVPRDNPLTVEPDENVVVVRVTASYNSVFPLFRGIEMSVGASAPYLYRH